MSETSATVAKGKHYGSEFLSAYAALRQKNTLDLRAADPSSFLQLKNRKDQFITELRAYRIDDAGIAALPEFPLHSMDVANSDITDASIKKIVTFSGLNRLDLSGIHLTAKDCIDLTRLTRMEELILSHCDLDDDCMKAITHFHHLDKLFVAKNKDITDSGVEYMADAKMPVYELNLNETDVTDRCVAALAKLPDIEILSLAHTKISDAALPQLTKLPKLRYLNLEHAYVNDAGLQKFKAKALLRLMLHGCTYSSAGVRAFKQLNPHCLVLPDEEETQN